MASIVKIGTRWRALIRKRGDPHCKTFGTRAQAKAWADTIEREIDELKAGGRLEPKGKTVGDLIDRYIAELSAKNQWGRSKSADLRRLKKEFADDLASNLTHERVLEAFLRMADQGTGGVGISSLVGYLKTVLTIARDVWRMNVPIDAVSSARIALKHHGLIKKSKHRDRRVSDAELEIIVKHVERKATDLPFGAIVWFSIASAMRISETCRIEWDDLDESEKTIRIRDRKHPSAKQGNHQVVPLLNLAGHDAFAIVKAQKRNKRKIFPVNAKTVGTYFAKAVSELNIEDLHFHDIRHEAITRLFEAGFQIHEVSVVSGHRDWSMLKRYTHVRAVDLHRVRT